MTEEIAADATISMGVQPNGYTIWVNGPFKCRIRICGLTEEQAQSIRDGLLDITFQPEKEIFYGLKADMDCPICRSDEMYRIEGSKAFICKKCGHDEE